MEKEMLQELEVLLKKLASTCDAEAAHSILEHGEVREKAELSELTYSEGGISEFFLIRFLE
jgi:hypothetical protein